VTSPEILSLLIVALVAFAAGAFVFHRMGRHQGRAEFEPEKVWLQRDLAASSERIGTLEQTAGKLQGELAGSRTRAEQAERNVADLSARIEEQQRAAEGRLQELQSARDRMKAEFQALAADILEDKSRRFTEQNSVQMSAMLNPLREQIGDFRKLVSDSYEKEGNARVALQTELQGELKRLLDLNLKLSDEANSLTRALTTDNRTQGYWGELKLERLLESAGLEKGQQYLTQESFNDADGDRYRPDAVLLLPEDRHIVIDAKMNLLDYQRGCDATDDAERERAMGQHVAAMRAHVRQLGDKDYSKLEGLQSPELVLMFVPVEGAFLEALRRDKDLYDDAFRRKIVLVGPGNLLASLRLVAQIWRTEQQNRNAQLIADRAANLYDKFVGFVEDMGKVGEALDRAQKQHQTALGKLSQGKGNLVRKVEELRRLGVAPSKRLPQPLLDASSDEALDGPENENGAE
jgi:DNA recombination protein RmuC